jgi:hypothetical protein
MGCRLEDAEDATNGGHCANAVSSGSLASLSCRSEATCGYPQVASLGSSKSASQLARVDAPRLWLLLDAPYHESRATRRPLGARLCPPPSRYAGRGDGNRLFATCRARRRPVPGMYPLVPAGTRSYPRGTRHRGCDERWSAAGAPTAIAVYALHSVQPTRWSHGKPRRRTESTLGA